VNSLDGSLFYAEDAVSEEFLLFIIKEDEET